MDAAIVLFFISVVLFGCSIFSMTKRAPAWMLNYTRAFAQSGQIAIVFAAFIALLNCFR